MSDEYKLMRDAAKGAQAQSLLDNDLLKEVYKAREEDIISRWITTNDPDGREKLWTMLHANRLHRDYLVSFVNDGKIAALQLSRNAEESERKKRWEDIK